MVDNSIWLCDACYKDIGSAQECYTDYNWTKVLCQACQSVIAVHHVVNRSGSISLQLALRERLPAYTVNVSYVLEPAHEDDPRPVPMYYVRATRCNHERNSQKFILIRYLSPEFLEDTATNAALLVASSITEEWDFWNAPS